MQRTTSLIIAGALLGVVIWDARPAYATIIDFDNWNQSSIPIDFGSRVSGTGQDAGGRSGFSLTHGPTPQIAVQMFTANYTNNTWGQIGSLFLWGSGYANLQNVAYHSPSSEGARFVFQADANWWARLHGFQLGGWLIDRTLPFLQVLVDGSPVLTEQNVLISGTTAKTYTFDPNVTKGSVVEIRFGGDWNVGIDNIAFSQEVIPEPATVIALGAGLAGLALRRRKR